MIIQIFADNDGKADVDGVSVENAGKGFGDNCLDAQSFQYGGSLLAGRTAAEIFTGYYEVAGFCFFGKVRSRDTTSICEGNRVHEVLI